MRKTKKLFSLLILLLTVILSSNSLVYAHDNKLEPDNSISNSLYIMACPVYDPSPCQYQYSCNSGSTYKTHFNSRILVGSNIYEASTGRYYDLYRLSFTETTWQNQVWICACGSTTTKKSIVSQSEIFLGTTKVYK